MLKRPRRDLKGLAVAVGGLFVVMALVAMLTPGKGVTLTVKDYGDFTLDSPGGSYNFDQIWDLTANDLEISYSVDLSSAIAQNPYWAGTYWVTWMCPWVSVGLTGGTNGWMCSGCPYSWGGESVSDPAATYALSPSDPNPGVVNLADKHNLQTVGGQDESAYDALNPLNPIVVASPFGSGNNYGIWFDRDSTDPYQDDNPLTPGPGTSSVPWGAVGGGTYDTLGKYDIVVTYHAISATLGTMFATVNGIQTGFYATWHKGVPDYYPAGKSITGDLTNANFFVSMWAPAGCGTVSVSDVQVTGVLATIPVTIDIKPGSDPNSICLADKGLLPVAILGSSSLDVRKIVGDSLMLGVDPTYVDIATRGPAKAPKLALSYEDVNGDGRTDLVAFFSVQELYADGTGPLTSTTTQLSLTGNLVNGNPILGSDSVRVIS